MMWIVILALRRPDTFVCMSLLIFIFGIFATVRMPVDIFPVINLPVVTVVWYFYGMAPEEMERRIVTSSERFYSSTANDIEHIESSSFAGVAVIKIYFQPTADVAAGVAQITAASEAIIKVLPPGATPPTIVRFNATDVPIAQLALASTSMSEDELNDYGNNFVRVPLATIRGAAIGPSVGGKPRQVMVDLDLPALYSKGLSPSDVRVQEFPNQVFAGRVVRTARAVDPQSRTLLTEVQIVNPKRVLLPGMYAEIRFVVSRADPPLIVPATALLPLTDGIHVVEVGPDDRVHRRKVSIVRDYGDYVEVDGGLNEGASVVMNPGDGLTDGTRVRVQARPVPQTAVRAAPWCRQRRESREAKGNGETAGQGRRPSAPFSPLLSAL